MWHLIKIGRRRIDFYAMPKYNKAWKHPLKIFTGNFLIYWNFGRGDQVGRKWIWGWLTLEREVDAHFSATGAIYDLISWSFTQGVCDWQTRCKKSVLGLHQKKKKKKKHFLSYFGLCWLDVFAFCKDHSWRDWVKQQNVRFMSCIFKWQRFRNHWQIWSKNDQDILWKGICFHKFSSFIFSSKIKNLTCNF